MKSAAVASAIRRASLAGLVAFALVLPLLHGFPGSAHAAEGFGLQIEPADPGNTAVRGTDETGRHRLVVSGTGPGSENVEAIELRGFDGDGVLRYTHGDDRFQALSPKPHNASSGDHVRNDDGEISGRLSVPCEFDGPATGCFTAAVLRSLTLRLNVGGTWIESDHLRVDFTRPFIRRYEKLSPTRIRVVFSEPVRDPNPGGDDSPSDWTVTEPSVLVANVTGPTEDDCLVPDRSQPLVEGDPSPDPHSGDTGCTRVLVLGSGVGDALPRVTYNPGRGREAYEDYASNTALRGSTTAASSKAIEIHRPPLPQIEAIAGKEPVSARVASSDPAPQVEVSNLVVRSGDAAHALTIRVTLDGAVVGEDTTAVTADTMTVAVPGLTDDAGYVVHAIACGPDGPDLSSRSCSTDVDKGPSQPDREPSQVLYLLDRVAPRAEVAKLREDGKVEVAFTENIYPSGYAGRWQIDGNDVDPVGGVSGSGSIRVLTPPQAVTPTSRVSWAPTPIPLSGRYADQAENPLPVFELAIAIPDVPIFGEADYTAFFVQVAREDNLFTSVIEARFDEELDGTALPVEWLVDGFIPRSVSKESVGGATVVRITTWQPVTDPNATPIVRYAPRLGDGNLRGADGQSVTREEKTSIDAVDPELAILRPSAGPINTSSVEVRGTTDATERPNTVRAYRTDGAGRRIGGSVASTTAAKNGGFRFDVPLERNTTNRVEIEARDPASNRTVSGFLVIEDSTAPVVDITAPPPNTRIPREVSLRWTTTDAHPKSVDIAVRVDGGSWRAIVDRLPDEGRFDWEVDDDIGERSLLDFRVTATDAVGLTGQAVQPGLSLGPLPSDPIGGPGPPLGGPGADGVTAIATSERTIDVTFPAPVGAARGAAGFSIYSGPGVARVGGTGTTRTLVLNGDLSTTTPIVIYNGQGVSYLDGRPAEDFRIRAARGFAFAPQGLVGDSREGTARLSWTDERNTPGDVARYEIRRDGTLIDSVNSRTRLFVDRGAGTGVRTYSIRTVDDLDHVSRETTVRIDPNAPNITPQGGFVLSADGQLALLVPPGAVTKDHFGRFESLAVGAPSGYRQVTGGHRLVVEAADDRSERLEVFNRFSCLSYRPGAETLGGHDPLRVSSLRLLDGGDRVEMPTRTGLDSAESCLLSPGTFTLGEAAGKTTRIYDIDPSVYTDRFATAVALSQTSFDGAGAAVLARANDYPDALASSALAAQVGGPVLLSTTDVIPDATILELRRLGVERVVLAGGTAALSDRVARQAHDLGFSVERVAGPTRYETAALIGERVGAFGGRAFVATGQGFADALAASSPSSMLTRPIFLTGKDDLPSSTVDGLRSAGVSRVTLLGGAAAVSSGVEQALRAEGFSVDRVFGPTRYETSAELAGAMAPEGLVPIRPIAASGQGDGVTSPDALAGGPIAARFSGPLLLVPRDQLGETGDGLLRRAGVVRGVVIAGGPVAIRDRTRTEIDAATR